MTCWVGGEERPRGTGKPHPKWPPQGITQHLGFFLEDNLFNPFLGRSRWGSVIQPWKRRGQCQPPSAPTSQGCRHLGHVSATHPSAAAPGRVAQPRSKGGAWTHCTPMRTGRASWIRRPSREQSPLEVPDEHTAPYVGVGHSTATGLARGCLSTSHVPWAGGSTALWWFSGVGASCALYHVSFALVTHSWWQSNLFPDIPQVLWRQNRP